MKLVFLGLPGAGKGLQAKIFQNELGLVHISTGDMLRELAGKPSFSKIELKIQEILGKGHLMPDEHILQLIDERLKTEKAERGYILDGFPRTIRQAEGLEKITTLDHVLYFQISEQGVIRRLPHRIQCGNCKTVYGIDIKPKQENICDECHGVLTKRNDDNLDIIKTRIKIYNEKTAPLVDFYFKKGLLRTIDAEQNYQEVSEDIRIVLSKWT